MRMNRIVVLLMATVIAACGAEKAKPQASFDPVEALIVWGDADPDDGEAPLTVELYCDPLEEIDGPEYVWDPGDGSDRIEGQKVTHTYERAGIYKARVFVTDEHGNRGEDEVRIDVELPEEE